MLLGDLEVKLNVEYKGKKKTGINVLLTPVHFLVQGSDKLP